MFCFVDSHKMSLEMAKFHEREVERLTFALHQMTERYEQAEADRRKVTDRLLTLTTGAPLYTPAAPSNDAPVTETYGNVNDYCRAAELNEAQAAADEMRATAAWLMKEQHVPR